MRRASSRVSRLILEIDVRERFSAVVVDDEAGAFRQDLSPPRHLVLIRQVRATEPLGGIVLDSKSCD
jgi:hypothetical protein